MIQPGEAAPRLRLAPAFGLPVDVPASDAHRVVLCFVRGGPRAVALVERLHAHLEALDLARIRPVLVVRADPDEARVLAAREHVLVPVVPDPDGALHRAFGLESEAGTLAALAGVARGLARAPGRLVRLRDGTGPLGSLPAVVGIDPHGRVGTAWQGRAVDDLPDPSRWIGEAG